MYRHRLAALFDPRSIIIVSDVDLPMCEHLPTYLQKQSLFVRLDTDPDPDPDLGQIATQLKTFKNLDLALLCVSPARRDKALKILQQRPPKVLMLLPNQAFEEDIAKLKEQLKTWCFDNKCMLLGPRAFGLQRPGLKLNLSNVPMIKTGKVAVVSQSRMLLLSVLDWAVDINVGLSTAVSLGDVVMDVDLPDILEYLAGDSRTDSIVVYLDKFNSGRELISALRNAASVKPVVILRAGRNDPDLIGDDHVFEAAVRRSGAIRVRFFVELFAVLKTMSYVRRPKGGRVALLGNGRAVTQLLWDVLDNQSGAVERVHLSTDCRRRLQEVLGPGTISENPVIPYAPLTGEHLIECLNILCKEPNVDAVMLILAPDDMADMHDITEKLSVYSPKASRPVLSILLGESDMKPLRRILDQAGTPAFRTPETAFAGIQALMGYHYNQQLLQQIRIPLLMSALPKEKAVQLIIQNARAEKRLLLNQEEGLELLAACHIPMVGNDHAEDAEFSVQEAIPAVRILVKRDPIFGPWIYLGEGGHEVTILPHDQGLDLPPLNAYLASELIHRSRIWKEELSSYIEDPVFEKLQKLLEAISDLISYHADIAFIEINPIVLGYTHLHIKQVTVRLTAEAQSNAKTNGFAHMTIYPYPAHLIEHKQFKDGTPWTVRPIRPEDADAMQGFIRGLSENSRYMRFVSMMTELTPKMLTRYTYVDYYKELALVATTEVPNPANRGLPKEIIIGFAHYLRNKDGVGAEYALVVADDWQRHGLGRALMSKLLQEARTQGLKYIEGFVLANNKPMLNLMTSLGLRNEMVVEEPTMRHVWMPFE